MKRSSSLLGGAFVVLGIIMLSARYLFGKNMFTLGPDDFWPVIILMMGVVFELVYFISLRAPGFLVPGGILTTYGLLFFFEVATDWSFAQYTWPIYIIGVAVGLFQLYLFSGRPKGLLMAAAILTGIAFTALIVIIFRIFLSTVDLGLVVPALLIFVGLVLVLGRSRIKSTTW